MSWAPAPLPQICKTINVIVNGSVLCSVYFFVKVFKSRLQFYMFEHNLLITTAMSFKFLCVIEDYMQICGHDVIQVSM